MQVEPRLMEINAGIFQGTRWDEIDAAVSRRVRPVGAARTPTIAFPAASRGAT